MSASVRANVDPRPSDYRAAAGGIFLTRSVLEAAAVSVGDCVRVTTHEGRAVVGRVAGELAEPNAAVRFDRFARQALKAFPHEAVLIERVELSPAAHVILMPAIDIPVGHVEEVSSQVRQLLAADCVPVRDGMLLYVRLGERTGGIIYDVHAVSGGEGLVTADTKLFLSSGDDHAHDHEHGADHTHTHTATRVVDTTYEDVGGLADQIRAVRELVELPLLFPQVYRQLGIAPPRGVIFYGAPGTGKTLLARSVANEINAQFTYVNGPEIVGTYSGQTEENLRKIFGEASLQPPAIIFIDEIDALAPVRGTAGTLSDLRAVTQLLALMDGLKRSEGVVVIGTTNRIEAIDPALRRAGRFDREVYFPTPSAEAREQILRVHTREMPLSDSALDALPEVARRAHGFVGADLLELTREAGLAALRRAAAPFLDNPSPALAPAASELVVEQQDFDIALQRVRPSSLREALMVDPGVTWDDVGGLHAVKQRLRELIEFGSNVGIVLYGPPGTGKTLLARAVAEHARVNFIPVQAAELFSQWLGESEEGVRRLFRTAQHAAPCIIFFDQLDAIAPRRNASSASSTQRVLNQLLAELDGLQERTGVQVIGATNELSLVDPAALRPGRFGVHLYVGLPDADERAEILRIHLKPNPDEQLVAYLMAESEGFSGADLAAVCQLARMRSGGVVRREDFRDAFRALSAASRGPVRAGGDQRPDTSPD